MDPRTQTHKCLTVAALNGWLRSAQPGDRLPYAQDDSGNSFANSNREDEPWTQRKLFNMLYACQKHGTVMLFQKHEDHVTTYIAIRVSPRTQEFVKRIAKHAG